MSWISFDRRLSKRNNDIFLIHLTSFQFFSGLIGFACFMSETRDRACFEMREFELSYKFANFNVENEERAFREQNRITFLQRSHDPTHALIKNSIFSSSISTFSIALRNSNIAFEYNMSWYGKTIFFKLFPWL